MTTQVMSEYGPETEAFLNSEDKELQRAMEFQFSVSGIESVQTFSLEYDLEARDPQHEAARLFIAYEMQASPALYVHPDFGVSSQSPSISFEPLIARGGKASRHGVFFAELTLDGRTIPVAVKPHQDDNATQTCMKDYMNAEIARQMRFYTPQPVGMLLDRDDKAYSLSLLDRGLTTLDSIDWSDFVPSVQDNPGMSAIFLSLAGQVAQLHAAGSSEHGDLGARNVAVSADGDVFMIDWEKAFLSMTEPRDAEVRYAHSSKDLSEFLKSLCFPEDYPNMGGIGIFYEKDVDSWDYFCKLFFDEYCHIRLFEVTQKSHHSQKERDVREELEQLELTLRAQLAVWQTRTRDFADRKRMYSKRVLTQ